MRQSHIDHNLSSPLNSPVNSFGMHPLDTTPKMDLATYIKSNEYKK